MSWLRVPQKKNTRQSASEEECALHSAGDPFWVAASLARRIANSHPASSFRELPVEDLQEAGFTRDDDPVWQAIMRDAVYYADEHLLPNVRGRLLKDITDENNPSSHRTRKSNPTEGNATSRQFLSDFEDPGSSLWRDKCGKTLALLKPNTERTVSGEAFAWVISLHDYSSSETRNNAEKLETFGLASSLSDTEANSVSDCILLTEGNSCHGEKMLFGRMTKGLPREHSNVAMKAAAFGDPSGYYQSINSLPSLFVWVEHNYIAA
ncbi:MULTISPECIES: hypothetical protein [Leisingera]|jgi:hypothetical protein|uniref:hypothetical protein n=1 Tax=Leisingera TaxID=191028 RepID=UPI00114EF955|nr:MULTISPECIES: hypothetical protein [Leisingera]QDI76747.1 hypothetical protein R2C4_13675 [Leisingera aquaemixtae]UWQ46491.1 hypothetical protein K3719_03760 [Leisingera aquaemixtae]